MQYELAPLEGLTTYLFRNAQAHHFGGITRYYTPFVSPHKDKTLNAKERRDVAPEQNQGLTVIPQILTANAQDFLRTAQELEQLGYETVNLNFGCPSATVTTKGKGAGILKDADKMDAFLDACFSQCPLKISVKTRIGFTDVCEWEDILEVYRQYPFEELIIHPRLRVDFYQNTPDWTAFGQALDTLSCPVCYNGDIFSPQDAARLTETFPKLERCMLGRGVLMNPALPNLLNHNGNLDKTTLRAFHDEIYEGYRRIQSGEKNVLYRMKELWFYLGEAFTSPESYVKKIRKAERTLVYESVVNSLFREQELRIQENVN